MAIFALSCLVFSVSRHQEGLACQQALCVSKDPGMRNKDISPMGQVD